jgi:hypothetical protein
MAPTASQKGWIRIDFNQSVWIPCLPVFPKGQDRKSWSALYAEHWWEASGLEHRKRQVDALRRSLEYLHEFAYSQLPCHMAVIHLPSPGMVPLLVGFGVWQAADRRGMFHREARQRTEVLVLSPSARVRGERVA